MGYSKDYIGSGKKISEGIVRVSIDLEKVKPHIYEFNGKKYLTFNVSEKREADQYGKTHSVYVSVKDDKSEDDDGSPF